MTLLEIYNSVVWRVWGEQTPPATLETYLKGDEGLIANICQRIMNDRNWWFMFDETTISVTASTATCALPTGFKEIVQIRFEDDDGNYREPLIEVREGYKYDNFFSGSEETEYPAYYEKQGDNIILIPTPSEDKTLHIQYYKYLPRPSATEATWDTHTDDLTENGADVIIAMTVQEVAEFLQDYQMASYWANKAVYAMRDLVRKDWSRKMPPGFQKEYKDY